MIWYCAEEAGGGILWLKCDKLDGHECMHLLFLPKCDLSCHQGHVCHKFLFCKSLKLCFLHKIPRRFGPAQMLTSVDFSYPTPLESLIFTPPWNLQWFVGGSKNFLKPTRWMVHILLHVRSRYFLFWAIVYYYRCSWTPPPYNRIEEKRGVIWFCLFAPICTSLLEPFFYLIHYRISVVPLISSFLNIDYKSWTVLRTLITRHVVY